MRSTFISASLLALAAGATAQTPNGTWPHSNRNLGVSFGSVEVTSPGAAISPDDVTSQPSIYSKEHYPDTYMIFMLDLSIPDSDVTTNETSTLVPGIATNRTTRLHWWNSNLKQTSNGSFVTAADGPSPYSAPRPRSGDTAHTYALYLFKQPCEFLFSSDVFQGVYYDGTSSSRFNYTLGPIVEQADQPLAGNYFTSIADS